MPEMKLWASRRVALLHLLGLGVWSQGTKVSAQQLLPSQKRSRRFTVPNSNSEGRIASRYQALASYFVEEIGNGVQLEMAFVPGGSFFMGSTAPAIPLRPLEQPIHKVSVRPFAIYYPTISIHTVMLRSSKQAHWRRQ